MRKACVHALFFGLLVVGMIALCDPGAIAQSDRGTITGTVSDLMAAVVSGAEVSATNVDTGVTYNATSNGVGLYSILNLPLGRYAVTFKKEGFKSVNRPNITISTAQVAQLDVRLEVGAATESVTVTEDAPVLETQTSDLGTNMKAAPLRDLPFNAQGGRHVEAFAFAITPGAEGDPYYAVISGGQIFTKEVVIDGTSQNASIQGDAIEADPGMEAIEEVQAQTSGLSAERGISSGGVINLGIKSGTNTFHGSAFGFGHNEFLDANSWANGYTHTAKPKQRFWDYGFSAGGPIFKDKTFIFGAFERFQQFDFTLGGFGATVPTTALLSGDFSAADVLGSQLCTQSDGSIGGCGSGTTPINVQNNAGQTVPLQAGMIFDPTTGNQFTGNVIPSDRISAVAQKIIPLYQQYKPQIGASNANELVPAQNSPAQTPNTFTIKVDHNLSGRNHLNGSFIYNHRYRLLNDSGGVWSPGSTDGGPLATARYQTVISKSWRVSESFAIRPNLLNVVSGTYNWYLNGSIPSTTGGNWASKLGIGSGYANNFPSIGFGNAVNGVGETYIGNSWQGNWVAATFIYGDTLSWVKGRHTFKFGLEFRAMQINSHSGDGTLHFNFTNDYTGAATAPYESFVGSGFASFLLGGVQSASVDTPFDLYGRRKSFSSFAQDDFRVNSKLTLNLGLRWEFTNPLHEKYGHWANFDTNLINPVTGTPGAMAFAKNGSDSFEKYRDWKDFGPTIGFAYSPKANMVIRGAFGLYYAPLVMNYYEGTPYGFAPGYRGTNQVPAVGPGIAAFNWDSGYPGVFAPGTKDPNYFPYGTVAIDPHALTLGYTKQWNLGYEYAIGKNAAISATYVANRGSRLHDGALSNFRAPASKFFPLFASGNAYDWVFDTTSAAAAGVPYPYNGFAGFAYQALSPFPQVAVTYGPIYAVDTPRGSSAYNAMQIEFKKRTGGGLTTNLSYTLSKSTGNTTSAFSESYYYSLIQDPTNLGESANTLTNWDAKHIFKGYATYDLPFGHGKRFLSDQHGFVSELVSGWTLGTIFNYRTGRPIYGFYSSNYYAYPDWTVTYMNYAPNISTHWSGHFVPPTTGNPTPSSDQYFDPSMITNPSYSQFGKGPARIDALRGFGYATENASILKRFTFGANDRFNLQLRFEFFNLFNRHYLSDPVSNPGSGQFGYVTGPTNDSPRQGQFGARFTW